MPDRPKDETTGAPWHNPGAGPAPTPATMPEPVAPPYGEPYTEPDEETGARRRGGVGYTTYVITVAVLLLAIAVVVFVVQNDRQVSIWLFGPTKVMSVAGALAAAAAAGLAVGLMIGFIPQIKLRRELRALRRGSRS